MMKEMNISGNIKKSQLTGNQVNLGINNIFFILLFYSSPLRRNNGSSNSLNIFEICLHNKGWAKNIIGMQWLKESPKHST